MISGYWISQAVYVAAKLRIADQLAQGPQDLNQLADITKTHQPSLYRLLRALASVGVFEETTDGRFVLTPNGTVIAAILNRYPNMKGILFDLPHVIERAKTNLASAGVADRCQTLSGNFFEAVPSGADVCLMRHIIHDWHDAKAITILRNCHNALNATGRVLIVKTVIAPGNNPSFAKLLDLTMMVLPGGKERTAEEYQSLLKASGFTFSQIVPTSSDVSIIEGQKTGS